MTGTILVTGGSGYIAGYLIQRLVARGWTVRATIRSLAREAEVRQRLGVPADKLHVFAADLERDDGWAEAVAGCSHVAHVASPFPAGVPKSDDELIVPAREGALRALRFARAAGVTRFVLTSSVAAVAYGHGDDVRPYTEADWTDVTKPDIGAYIKSKTIAERAARDWIAEHGAKDGGGMEFCTVNPSLVLGPLFDADQSASIQIVQRLLDGSMPGTPRVGFAVVDVRDLADLHVLAIETPGLDGERFIAAGRFMWMAEVAEVLRARLGAEARKVPKRGIPDLVVRLLALFDRSIGQITPELGRTRAVSSRHALERLGWKTRAEEESIVDTARSLIDQGIVKV